MYLDKVLKMYLEMNMINRAFSPPLDLASEGSHHTFPPIYYLLKWFHVCSGTPKTNLVSYIMPNNNVIWLLLA